MGTLDRAGRRAATHMSHAGTSQDGSSEAGNSDANSDADNNFKRLRWRCRRGMRELDVLLTRWLDREWAAASESQRGVFLHLLDCEDDKLWRWFLGNETPPDDALDALIRYIRDLPPAD